MLSEFRERLIKGGAEQKLFEKMLSCFVEKGLLKAPKQQRTDSTHILAAIRVLGRLENMGETLRSALNSIDDFSVAHSATVVLPMSNSFEQVIGERVNDSNFIYHLSLLVVLDERIL